MSLRNIRFETIGGTPTSLADYAGQAVLVVNVASKCGLTPQYETLEELQRTYGERGFTVLGFPCNQFAFQEPGSAETIQEFCSLTYGVTFPLMEKVKVNGRHAHPLFAQLTQTPDANGKAGKVKWNFEKFLISPVGAVHRFRPTTLPNSPEVIAAIEAALP
ncbi:glutathione peroxidase [Klugiella xanthotipulae]|uniref:Glutathione peroxidase n=1 Tax=Klugiella xanthotipulae TaxID=244735 RepID=A0A543HHA0_9MICO|nr:glutathione peroxidase [Klugiella xanthotipulae]TQM57706.1 glutathione peroxidase [Klugiella xanthotipulae]